MKTFFHPAQLKHAPQSYFTRGQMRSPQEVPERAERLLQGVETIGLALSEPADYGMVPLTAVHDMDYLRFLRTAYARWHAVSEDWGEEVMSNIFVRENNAMRGVLAQAARYLADGSCPIGEHTWEAAYWSAQSAVAAAHAVLDGDKAAYALSRPPGHHARRDAAGGFCYINNAAVAAQALRQKYQRVVVLDTDMHHGQGVQEIFYDRRDVYYVSIHADTTNFYPVVCGFEDERGSGDGLGYNLNLPMPHGVPESVFFERLHEAVITIECFAPEALVLCLGFDIYQNDPQSQVDVSTEGFERLAQTVAALQLPTVVVQEGGYDVAMLDTNLESFFKGLNI